MPKSPRDILLAALVAATALLAGCSNEARVTIDCKGYPVSGCVDNSCYDIDTDASRTWILEWRGGFPSGSSKKFTIYAEDLEYPDINSTEEVELNDGDHFTFTVNIQDPEKGGREATSRPQMLLTRDPAPTGGRS